MTPLTQSTPHSTTSGRHRARGATHGPTHEARTQRSFDAVLASYIRELSANGDTTARRSAGHGPRSS
jgi:hypothetical protein